MKNRTVLAVILCAVVCASGCSLLKSAGSALLADLGNCSGKELATASPQLTSLVQSGNQTSIESELTGDLGQDVACTLNAMASSSTLSAVSPTGSPSLSVQASTALSAAIKHGKLKSTPRPASANCPGSCAGASTAPATPHPDVAGAAPPAPQGTH